MMSLEIKCWREVVKYLTRGRGVLPSLAAVFSRINRGGSIAPIV